MSKCHEMKSIDLTLCVTTLIINIKELNKNLHYGVLIKCCCFLYSDRDSRCVGNDAGKLR